jgi:hypothetical protein
MFYERPDGVVVKTYGFGRDGVKCYTEDGSHFTAPDAVFQTWKPRPDLQLFPGSTDMVLPYEFDLNWDIKLRSQLKHALDTHEDAHDIRAAMIRHGITLDAGDEGDNGSCLKSTVADLVHFIREASSKAREYNAQVLDTVECLSRGLEPEIEELVQPYRAADMEVRVCTSLLGGCMVEDWDPHISIMGYTVISTGMFVSLLTTRAPDDVIATLTELCSRITERTGLPCRIMEYQEELLEDNEWSQQE